MEYHQLQRTEIEGLIDHLPEADRDSARKTAAKAIIQEDGKAKLRQLWHLLRDANELHESTRSRILDGFERLFPWLPELDFTATQVSFYKVSGVYDLVIHAIGGKPLSHESDVIKRVMAFIPANRDECRKYLNDKIGSTKVTDLKKVMPLIKLILEVFGIPLMQTHTTEGKVYILDGQKMWQPWKKLMYDEFKLKAKSSSATTPVKVSVGFFSITPDLPFESTTSDIGFDISDFLDKKTEVFYDGNLYYIWDDRLHKYLSLDPAAMKL